MKVIAHSPEIRDLAYVPRWAIVRTNRPQNVAEHSYFVALLVEDMISFISKEFPKFFVEERIRHKMIMCALYHDIAEGTTGDITGPIKNRIVDKDTYRNFIIQKEKSLVGMSPTECEETLFSAQESMILKTADFLESILFLVDEVKSGNTQLNKLLVELRSELSRRISEKEKKFEFGFCSALLEYTNIVLGLNFRPSNINSY